jgi:DNA-binding MarR family transcriptional regulator
VEQKLRRDPADRRARRARDSLAQRYGLSGDAFTVYSEFYRLGRQIVSEQADRL